jgi:hypothetical protein
MSILPIRIPATSEVLPMAQRSGQTRAGPHTRPLRTAGGGVQGM